ncbi:MAG: family membership [Vicinamibacteria bacterium]
MVLKIQTRRMIKGFVVIAGLGIFCIAALLGSLSIERASDMTLPALTGSFAVGRATYDWSDDAHADPLAQAPGARRELLVWIWYPAEPRPEAPMDDYLPASTKAPRESGNRAPLIFRLLTRDASMVHGHVTRGASWSRRQRSYPVVILRGGASAPVSNYSTLAEDLASHGYVVVGIDAPFRTGLVVFPDGRVIARTPENNPELYSGQEFVRVAGKLMAAWTADLGFVLDRLEQLNTSNQSETFAGKLDLTRVGVFGHSFGGAQAAQFCSEDSRCKAGIDIDGAPFGSVIRTGLKQPFMFLLSDHGDASSDPDTRRIKADIQSIYDRLPAEARMRVEIRGASHFTFSDDGALLKSRIVRGALRAFGKLGIDGRRQLEVTAYCVHSFFDTHLKSGGASLGGVGSALYPEIRVIE